jgi:hypothetical protein
MSCTHSSSNCFGSVVSMTAFIRLSWKTALPLWIVAIQSFCPAWPSQAARGIDETQRKPWDSELAPLGVRWCGAGGWPPMVE